MFSKKAIYECVLMNETCSKSMLVEKDSFAQPWLLYKWKKDIKIVLILNSYLITSNMKKKKSMDSDYTPGEKRSLHSWLLRQNIHLTAEKSLQTFYQIKHLSTYH